MKTQNELRDLIVKREKFKIGLGYTCGELDPLNSVASIYWDSMTKAEIIADLERCIARLGVEECIQRLKRSKTYKDL